MNFGRPQHFGKDAIEHTPDLARVLALPRRRAEDVDAKTWARELTSILKTPGGTMSLRDIQGQALYEAGKYGGGFFPIRVGGGKTLISLSLPFVMGAERPILLLPAGLKEKTEDDRRLMGRHFRVARDLRLISFEELGRVAGAETLTYYKPDLIIIDEAHRLKNKKAGVTRRVLRYMRENPETKCVAMSGTMIKGGTIKAFAHILRWCLKKGAPIPLEEGELEEWASALDEGTDFNRPRAGALLQFATREDTIDGDELRTARRGFHRRLTETPGVVSTGGDQVACSLYVRALQYKPNEITDENFKNLRNTWTTPNGWPLSMAAEVWRVARELAMGFHGEWAPPPEGGKEGPWMQARKAWAAFVRKTLQYSRTLDTELQVVNACADGELDDSAYVAWREIKDTYRIKTRDVWHDTSALEACEKWIKAGPGIVWVEHVFFGDELERRTGVPYFREGGEDKKGNKLDALANLVRTGAAKATPVIASVAANSTGRNLQPWSRNLITSCPSGAATLEQLLGRTHRDGQLADQVEVDILLACVEHADSWYKARAEAQMTADTMGDAPKILMADPIFPTEQQIHMLGLTGGARWRKTRKESDDAD